MSDELPADGVSNSQVIASVAFTAEDPYRNVEVDELPRWWQANIREFEDHDLRTYLPSRFTDGAIVPLILRDLEAEYDVNIRLVGVGVQYGDDWEVRVDGETVATIQRRRDRSGFTVFEIPSNRFVELVKDSRSDT